MGREVREGTQPSSCDAHQMSTSYFPLLPAPRDPGTRTQFLAHGFGLSQNQRGIREWTSQWELSLPASQIRSLNKHLRFYLSRGHCEAVTSTLAHGQTGKRPETTVHDLLQGISGDQTWAMLR